ncbi:capsid protein [Copiparvovirus P220T/pangolin/2018]|nr:capsid protein [Copiparvovirus P220T/pangolin/2018]
MENEGFISWVKGKVGSTERPQESQDSENPNNSQTWQTEHDYSGAAWGGFPMFTSQSRHRMRREVQSKWRDMASLPWHDLDFLQELLQTYKNRQVVIEDSDDEKENIPPKEDFKPPADNRPKSMDISDSAMKDLNEMAEKQNEYLDQVKHKSPISDVDEEFKDQRDKFISEHPGEKPMDISQSATKQLQELDDLANKVYPPEGHLDRKESGEYDFSSALPENLRGRPHRYGPTRAALDQFEAEMRESDGVFSTPPPFIPKPKPDAPKKGVDPDKFAQKESEKERDSIRKNLDGAFKQSQFQDQWFPGLVYPGHKYTGPGNPQDSGPPTGPIDESSQKHDLRYGALLDHGELPYICAKEIDKLQSRDIDLAGEGESMLGNLIKGLWHTKGIVCDAYMELLGKMLPPKTLEQISSDSQDASEREQSHLGKQESTGSTEKSGDLGPPDPKKCKTDINPPCKASSALSEESSASPMSCSVDIGGSPAGATQSSGGGGGQPRCEGTWHSGTIWDGEFVTTQQVRRCQLNPFNDKYISTPSWDENPGVDILTPWQYIDLNLWSCHWPPADFQTLLETCDSIKPVELEIKIQEVVFKDVSTSDNCTTVQDSQSAQMLVFEDTQYVFPYVMGGGQQTVPGHLPGGNYVLPRYGYRTMGTIDPVGGAVLTAPCPPFRWKASQNTETFFLENHTSKILHSGNCYSQRYKFPENLHYENLTQYPYNVRRQDNPWCGQRLLTIQSKKKATDDQTTEVVGAGPQQMGWKSHKTIDIRRAPAQWLSAPRFRDGDYMIVSSLQKNMMFSEVLPPVILARDTFFGAGFEHLGRFGTLQPGPRTQEGAIQTPDGTIKVTTNAQMILQPVEHEGIKKDTSTLTGGKGRLVIQNVRGQGGPSEPDHVRERILNPYDRSGNVEPDEDQKSSAGWANYQLQKGFREITLGAVGGQPVEFNTGHMEIQLWQKEPNVDQMIGHQSPIALWGMKTPPPQVFLRMLPSPGIPSIGQSACASIQEPDSYLNQYCYFLINYKIKWQVTPRKKGTARWNPVPPVMIPMGSGGGPVYTLDERGNYTLPQTVWTFKQRLRQNR